MLSIGKTPPNPNKRTLARAGTNCVVVTRTLTQLLRELIRVKHLVANVNQLSVSVSISALNCNHCSLLAGPRRPPTL